MVLLQLIFCGVLLLISSGCLFSAISMYNRTKKFLVTANSTFGTLAERDIGRKRYHQGRYHRTRRVTFLNVTFIDHVGTSHTIKRKARLLPLFIVGNEVRIFYDPANPSGAQIAAYLWQDAIGLGALGTVFLIGGIGAIFAK